jgi:hypothetical protein
MSGKIEVTVPLPADPVPFKVQGSPIQAATQQIQLKTNEQQGALDALGGKMKGGGIDVPVENIPFVTSAGNSNPSRVFADMVRLKAVASENGKYDSLGGHPPQIVGGKRRTRRNNARRLRKGSRKHKRSHKRLGRVRHIGCRLYRSRRKSAHS